MAQKSQIERNARRLQLLLRVFNENRFYSITVDEHGISMQGYFDKRVVKKAQKLKFVMKVDDSGYITFSRGDYRIVLT